MCLLARNPYLSPQRALSPLQGDAGLYVEVGQTLNCGRDRAGGCLQPYDWVTGGSVIQGQ
eukprot:359062-Chlamydomonas_euryale.AAC.18